MTNAPYLMAKLRGGARIGHQSVQDSMFLDGLEDAYDTGRLMGRFAKTVPKPISLRANSRMALRWRPLTRRDRRNLMVSLPLKLPPSP